jgi:AraC-like DNA-binding protein
MDCVFASDGVTPGEGAWRRLSNSLPQLAQDLFLRPTANVPSKLMLAIGHLIDEQLYDLLQSSKTSFTSQRIYAAFHRVRQAEELMHALSDEPLSMLDIAQTLGVSLRSLQLAFNEVYDGLGPRDVLNRIRLEKARQRLLAAQAKEHLAIFRDKAHILLHSVDYVLNRPR